ncbi:MAG: glycosyltransferase family 4 protein [Candidatus Methanomethylicia archaeon]
MLVQFQSSTRGGGEVMFNQLAHELANRGHEIHVIKHRMLSSNERDINISNSERVIFYDIFPPVEHKGGLPATVIHNLLYVLNAVRHGVKIVRKRSVNLIHANSYSPILAGWLISKITKRPLLVTIHDVGSIHGMIFWERWMKQFGRLSILKALIGYAFELLSIKLSRNIHTVSETSKKDILQIGFKNKNIYVISNSLDLRLYPGNDNVEYENEIVFIGRLVFYKNLEVVLKALKYMSSQDVKLTVIGDGPMKKHWQKLAEDLEITDKVEFKGYVPHEEKIKILRRASALVLPSLFEGFGIVILEAWAYKKPVIVSNTPPLNQIVEHGKDGIIVDLFKTEEWAKYISLLINNKELAKELGLNGYSKLIKNYNIVNWTTRFEKLYYDVASSFYIKN